MYNNWKKYLATFLITATLFTVSWSLSTFFNKEKVSKLQDTQDRIASDVVSSEAQFDTSRSKTLCEDSTQNNADLSLLAEKIAYGENNLNAPEQLLLLKKQYTLIQAKDFLLMKRIANHCSSTIPTILYFYSTKESCTQCDKQATVLDAVRRDAPAVHVYSFDYNLDSPTVRALRSIYKVQGQQLPVVVINGKTYNGFMSLADIQKIIPPAK